MHELINIRTGKEIRFPSELMELTPEQYLFYLDVMLQHMSGALNDPTDIKRRIFAKFTDLKVSWKMRIRPKQVQEAVWEDIDRKADMLDSFFDISEQNGRTRYAMKMKCHVNLLPEWNGYIGAQNFFKDITWAQFKQCLSAMKLLRKAESEKKSNDIVRYSVDIFRALYKPGKKAKPLSKYPDTVLFHAINWFAYWYELISTQPLGIDGEQVDFSLLWKKSKDIVSVKDEPDMPENEFDKSGWTGITFMIAETGALGDADTVDRLPVGKVLMFLYKQRCDELFQRVVDNKFKQTNP